MIEMFFYSDQYKVVEKQKQKMKCQIFRNISHTVVTIYMAQSNTTDASENIICLDIMMITSMISELLT